jgi:hypothetical protein
MLRDYRIVMSALATVDPGLVRGVRSRLATLETVSHSPTQNWGQRILAAAGSGAPTGGDGEHPSAPEWAAFAESYHRRTVSYFRRQIAGCRTVARLVEIREEIDSAIGCWRRMPLPAGQEPEYGSPQWKRWVAESDLSHGEIARRFMVSRSYIQKVRREYGGS